jgi:aerobic-type carbon monoxide dehydrogenase small subunit (CoxS/CutS family)
MIKLKVNGKNQQFNGDPEMPLLWVLRDELDLKGTKYGCGMGLCGACTVHLNGRPIRACLTPVSAAANKSVTTIEGLVRIRCKSPGRNSTCRNVVTAKPGKLCRRARCWRKHLSLRMRTLIPQ